MEYFRSARIILLVLTVAVSGFQYSCQDRTSHKAASGSVEERQSGEASSPQSMPPERVLGAQGAKPVQQQ